MGRGRAGPVCQVAFGSLRMKVESYHFFMPPSQGRLSRKLAPPATIRAFPLTPAKGEANPSASGREGSWDQWRVGIFDCASAAFVAMLASKIKMRMAGAMQLLIVMNLNGWMNGDVYHSPFFANCFSAAARNAAAAWLICSTAW